MIDALKFRGKHEHFLHDTTDEIDLEGALCSGKTIVALWKELIALEKYPGIWTLIARWSEDDVNTLLRPEFERLARLFGMMAAWNNKEKAYECANGSRVFAFGLRTTEVDPLRRYGKIRGLAVSRIYIDQAEQLPDDFPLELRRRLRPNIEAVVRGDDFPRQLTFSPNPTDKYHWLGKQFPEENNLDGRKYYGISLLDNAHNLPESTIRLALQDCPPTHPMYRSLILGLRPDWAANQPPVKKPFPPDSAGALFEQAKVDAFRRTV